MQQVQEQPGQFMEEIIGSRIAEARRGNDTVYTCEKRVGVKGQSGGWEEMDNLRLIQLLDNVPETRLVIFDIARRFLRPDGTIDYESFPHHPDVEVQFAIDQADNYLRRPHSLNDRLAQLAARSTR